MSFQVRYSALDRLVHRVAFSVPTVQFTAAAIEQTVFRESYARVTARRPIFIASLPRAGTTLLLEALHRFPSLATHTYRDMPFVMAPIFWARLMGAFHKYENPQERAHGDGMLIGYDSPEAFEEILWRAFWPGKYTQAGIVLWKEGDTSAEATEFLTDHMRKIIALRRPERMIDGRYLSKNNVNLARIDLICRMFPDARILVPVRRPYEHARSLLRQHLNFVQLHDHDSFTRRYMEDIGHYEFGALHQPIMFSGLSDLTAGRYPFTADYWLGYWIAAFEHVLSRRAKVVPVSYEEICAEPKPALARICDTLGLATEGQLDTVAALFRSSAERPRDDGLFDAKLLARADRLHSSLLAD